MLSCPASNKKLFIVLFILISSQGFSQLSKTHYIPPLTNAEFGNANPEQQYIYLSTPSGSDIPYTIKPVGQPASNYITGNVSNTNPQEIFLQTGIGQLFIASSQTSVITNDKGYIIEAEGTIYVSVRMNAGNGAQAGALVSKGLTALGRTFRVGSFTNENPQSNYLNFVSVMATEDDTEVTFSNLPAGLVIKNHTGTTPISITLNEGESYTIATNSSDSVINRDGLIGCLVSSTKDIVVNCGSANGSFSNGNGRDYGIDQIVDLSKVGTEYIFVKGDGTNAWENVLIVAHTNNTTISINGNAPTATINAGEYHLIEGNSYTSVGNMYVETSQPVFAYQGIGATTSEANQGLFFVPPLSCETRGNLDNIANIEDIGSTTYTGGISIVTKVGATVTINNSPISNFSTIGPSAVLGKPDYITYKVLGLFGNISVQSSDELYCAYFNFNGAATSGSFYSGFPSAPEINFDAQFVTLGNCIPNITLSAANTQNFDSFEWWFDDGSASGFVSTNISTPDLTPTIPGKYKLIGIVTCSGLTLESVDVPVSICPDDIDNDGIIDNIDIDNDNDGILNCTESRGDVTLNLSNTNSPQLVFQDGTVNTTIATATYTQNNSSGNTTNSITGTNLGNFTSNVQPANSAESNYSLSFTEPVNVKLMEDLAVNHIETDGEVFIAKILPVNKNITLVDPDDRLLVDSNFDGIFETGITQISGSEIHFKINPSPTGNTPYQFLANQVDGFSFIHKLINISTDSGFSGILSLTCFKNDNDFDGIKDALDLDSDNDGIPDFIENTGVIISLSGIDEDSNGLDDAYNISTLPIDSDNDTVLDFYDLDSDNDGITDLVETGQLGLLSDTDLNGIIDSGGSFGINGWDDNAETIPDSNLIGYTLNDFDGDTIFSYIDEDSDGDGCSDVIEAGFSDANNDNYLGDGNVLVDLIADLSTGQGLVTNASDGYTLPNSDYLTAAPINIITQPTNQASCELGATTFSIETNTIDSYQWQVSSDGVTWTDVIDNANYSNATTNALTVSNTPLSFQNYSYRVSLNINGNSCGLISEEIILTVNPLPIVTTPVVLIQCDNDTDGISFFNLTEANNEISTNAVNETFSYYLSQSAAALGDITSSDYIASPLAYENSSSPLTDVAWARIESQFGCASISEIQLNVAVSQIPVGAINEIINRCDDFLDTNGNDNTNNDDRDGIATFDFSYVRNIVENFFLPQTPFINFYRNEADALAEINVITDISNYRNIGYRDSQQIYIRVDSQIDNDCQVFGPYITLNVESLPTANPVTIDRQCDFDTTDDAVNYPFNTSQIESDLLNGQSLADVTVTYSDENNAPLPSPLPDPFLTTSQIITARVTNNTTLDPNGACYDETTIEFIIDKQPVANPVIIPAVCDGDDGLDDTDGLHYFDTSTIQNTILDMQTGMEVYYTYRDEFGNLITSSPSLPNPLISGTQTFTVDVINPINPTCTATTNIELIVNPLPNFSIETPLIVCSSNPDFTVTLDPLEDNTLETYTYEWVYEDGTILSNNSTLTVSIPGTYSITLTKTDGTGCSRTRDVFVNASEIATITLNDISIVDVSDNNSITINEANLGLGDYEYALDDEFSFYQDEPFFDKVKAGIHTIYIRDKNGCGTSSIEVSVIGYPKYFTPNGDGDNDSWQILGINSQFQPNSTIYIFDRYGKLIKQLSPLSTGWDGTFNGKLLNTNDYWFKVLLQDGRLFMGHFTLKR